MMVYCDINPQQTEPFIREVCRKHIRDAVTIICGDESWDNINSIPLVFVGGTSALLSSYIKEEYGNRAIVFDDDDSRYANVKGFLISLNEIS